MLGLAYGRPVILVDEELSDPPRFWETIPQTWGAPRRPGSLNRRAPVRALPGRRNVTDTRYSSVARPYPASLVRLIRDKAPHIRIGNFYGPTEAVIDCIAGFIDARQTGSIPIGKPMPNYRAYILDAYGQPLPVGVPGETVHWRRGPGARLSQPPRADGKSLHPQSL